jgi:hypothetical protein
LLDRTTRKRCPCRNSFHPITVTSKKRTAQGQYPPDQPDIQPPAGDLTQKWNYAVFIGQGVINVKGSYPNCVLPRMTDRLIAGRIHNKVTLLRRDY